MATSLETTSLSSPDKSLSRKRKQDFSTSSSSSSLAGWTDYLYSSPSSPSTSMSTTAEANPLTHHQPHHQDSSSGCDFNFDSIFGQSLDHVTCTFDFGGIDHMQQQQQSSSSGSTSRRHSVAVGEIDYHSFPAAVKQEFRYDTDLQQLLGLPSSWSSSESSSVTPENVAPHKRTMSLRLETNHSAYNQQQQPASPTTPNFFSPGFLDALNADEDKDTVFTFPTDTSFTTQSLAFMDHQQQQQQDFVGVSPSPSSSSVDAFLHHHNQGTAEQQQQQQRGGLVPTNTIAPSAISSNNMNGGGWMTDRRHAKSRLSPPTSPSNNTISSSSPSPPVTPMQAVGYDSHTFKHPAIPEEDEEMTSAPQEQERRQSSERSSSLLQDDLVMSSNAMRATTTTKGSLVAARMQLGASTAATLKPHIRNYLLSNDPAGSGERTVMILTSKVAQKSYGTEKRFLCPPPSTVLMGASWWTSDCTHSSSDCNTNSSFYSSSTPLAPPKLTVNISGEQTIQNGNIEWYTSTGALLDGSAAAAAAAAGDTAVTGKCVSKHLHINDADEKRKRVEVRVQMQLGNGVHLGTLASKGIKVISKPSKKRQSVKNMELCIHHGTTISLFNRIRSQTVSTKYLGVSTSGQQGSKGGNNNNNNNNNANGTCFVARTGSWDPFVIWIVDTSRAPDIASIPRKHHPTNPHYPPPPAIALQTDPSQQPMAIHYNQAVVLQCVTTGLVSPVMVIRKVDKGSMVLGGSKVFDDIACTTGTGAGGECGDECLGDPVSQLHKVAFQIVQDPSMAHSNKAAGNFSSRQDNFTNGWTLPQSCQPITYLACLNDVVGMHKTATARTFTSQPPDVSDWSSSSDYVVSQESAGGKVVRKRRVSCDVVKPNSLPAKLQQQQLGRRRVNSVTDVPITRRGSTCSALSDHRRSSTDSNAFLGDGACWTEDVSDAAIWTIVGTDCATYTFWTPSPFVTGETIFNSPFTASSNLPQDPTTSSPITPFPVISQISPGGAAGDRLLISGEGFSRDLAVWFGDVKAPLTEYKARDSLACAVPDIHELLSSPVTTIDQEDGQKKLPILLVRGDGVVYQTGRFYSF